MTRAQPKDTKPSAGVKFKEPPVPRKRYDWDAIAKRCRRTPGKFLLVFEGDKQTFATAIRQDGISALQKHKGFDIETRNNNINARPRTCDLYLRYRPEFDTTIEGK